MEPMNREGRAFGAVAQGADGARDTDFLKEGVRACSRRRSWRWRLNGGGRRRASRAHRGTQRASQRLPRENLGHTRVGTVELSVPRVRDAAATSSPRC